MSINTNTARPQRGK